MLCLKHSNLQVPLAVQVANMALQGSIQRISIITGIGTESSTEEAISTNPGSKYRNRSEGNQHPTNGAGDTRFKSYDNSQNWKYNITATENMNKETKAQKQTRYPEEQSS